MVKLRLIDQNKYLMKTAPALTQDLAKFIYVLRFRKFPPGRGMKTFMTVREISRLTGVSQAKVNAVCRSLGLIKQPNQPNASPNFRKLSKSHLEFLTSADTLEEWRNYSLSRRCVLFHRVHPEVHISPSTLRRVYKAFQINFKVMVDKKRQTPRYEAKLALERYSAFNNLFRAREMGEAILYMDETLFRPFNVTQKSWARKSQNQIAHKIGISTKSVAAAVCINAQKGLVAYVLREKSIKVADLIHLISKAQQCMKNIPVTVFADNLRGHHNKEFKKTLEGARWRIIYNAPYSPQFHCIEQTFASVKRRYKKEILEKDYNLTSKTHIDIVQRSLAMITAQLVQKVEASHLDKMKLYISDYDKDKE